ncbi:hypothetical protein [Thermomonas fusca]|uniref:hypothetical protein n=1 Tax=Thermomonas fusca TaxID=215690 RepID=UPI000424E257|nr:hypothetical protein [Thermomonas fusca]
MTRTAQSKPANHPRRPQRALRTALSMLMGAALTVSLSASADWRVYDDDVHDELKEVNKKLDARNKVGQGDFEQNPTIGEQQGRYKDPPRMFTQAEQDSISQVSMTEGDRCPEPPTPEAPDVENVSIPSVPSSANGIAQQQWTICKELLETEKAQFKYNVMMSDLAQKRFDRLQVIQRERRNNIDDDNAGRIESNTNKILALLTLIQIDQQQQKAYNDAYTARIAYLRAMQNRLGQKAFKGTGGEGVVGPGGSANHLAGDIAAFSVMQLAFSDGSPIHAARRD